MSFLVTPDDLSGRLIFHFEGPETEIPRSNSQISLTEEVGLLGYSENYYKNRVKVIAESRIGGGST